MSLPPEIAGMVAMNLRTQRARLFTALNIIQRNRLGHWVKSEDVPAESVATALELAGRRDYWQLAIFRAPHDREQLLAAAGAAGNLPLLRAHSRVCFTWLLAAARSGAQAGQLVVMQWFAPKLAYYNEPNVAHATAVMFDSALCSGSMECMLFGWQVMCQYNSLEGDGGYLHNYGVVAALTSQQCNLAEFIWTAAAAKGVPPPNQDISLDHFLREDNLAAAEWLLPRHPRMFDPRAAIPRGGTHVLDWILAHESQLSPGSWDNTLYDAILFADIPVLDWLHAHIMFPDSNSLPYRVLSSVIRRSNWNDRLRRWPGSGSGAVPLLRWLVHNEPACWERATRAGWCSLDELKQHLAAAT